MQDKKIVILITAAVIIVGALLRREYVAAGHWTSVVAILFYIAACFPATINNILSFKSLSSRSKARVAIFFVFVYIAAHAIITVSVGYFFTLALLGADYLLVDTPKNSK